MSPWQPSFETEDSIGRQFKSRFCLISSRNCIRNLSDAEMFSLMSNWSPLYLPQSRILGLPPLSRQGQSVEGQARGRREEGEKKGREEKGRGEGREGKGREGQGQQIDPHLTGSHRAPTAPLVLSLLLHFTDP